MRVSLLDYTGNGYQNYVWYAADLMIFTKNTRVKMTPHGLSEIAMWPEAKKIEELKYMANTIRSSWEFVDYTFMIEDVTRAFTHQLVRTRQASYAQQTQQILKIDPTHVEPPRGEMSTAAKGVWDYAIEEVASAYESMLIAGATVEQARGILPTNIRTNIVAKMNLRTLVDLFHSRISPRNLGEFRDVAVEMRDLVLKAHPWASIFLDQTVDKVTSELDEEIAELRTREPEKATRMLKLVDQIRRGS